MLLCPAVRPVQLVGSLEGNGVADREGLSGSSAAAVGVLVDAVGELEIPVVPDQFVTGRGLGFTVVGVATADVRGTVASATGVGGVVDVGAGPAAVLGGQD